MTDDPQREGRGKSGGWRKTWFWPCSLEQDLSVITTGFLVNLPTESDSQP